MLRFAPSCLLLASLGASACGVRTIGTASVVATFDEDRCRGKDPSDALRNYGYDADYMATERFKQVLIVTIQKFKVHVEETDGLRFRLDLDQMLEDGQLVVDAPTETIVRADRTAPLLLPLTLDPDGTNAVLSLFQTCPEHPAHQAMSGTLRFDELIIAEDPKNMGRGELMTGTLTATITRSSDDGRVGDLLSVFDFEPPRRPLSDPK